MRAQAAIRRSGLSHREIARRIAETEAKEEDERRKVVRWDPEDGKPLVTWISDREVVKLAAALGVPAESILPTKEELRAKEAARLVRQVEALGGFRALRAAARLARDA